jgi:hypothetical protein
VTVITDPAVLTRVNLSPDWLTPSESGGYAIDAAHAMEKASELWDDVEETISLPIFSASAPQSGGMVTAGISVRGADLLASGPSEIKLIKIIPNGLPRRFQYSADDSGDGTFSLQTPDGEPYTGAIAGETAYKLVLSIKDGGDYDIDNEANGSVLDPAVIVRTKSSGESGASSGGSDTQAAGSSGGGCGTGLFTLTLLSVLGAMARRRK